MVTGVVTVDLHKDSSRAWVERARIRMAKATSRSRATAKRNKVMTGDRIEGEDGACMVGPRTLLSAKRV